MMILTRRPGESLNIGKDVEVFVLGVKGNQVRIGIKASVDIPVDRHEIYLKKQAEHSGNTKP